MLGIPGQPEVALQEEERTDIRVRSSDLESELTVERALRERAQRTADLLWRLQSLTAAFARAKTPDEVADACVDAGLVALEAESGALALLDDEKQTLTIVRSAGYYTDVENSWRTFSVTDDLPLSEAVRNRDVVLIESVEERNKRYPALARTPTPNNSFACVPLLMEARVLGGLTYSFEGPRNFSDDERSFLLALGQLTAQALERTRLFEAEHEARDYAEASAAKLRVLAEASDLVASSLDYETTLQSVAKACVPQLGDWCVIDLLHEDGTVKTLAVEHSDPAKIAWALELREKYGPDPDSKTNAVLRVIQTGRPELFEDIGDELLVAGAKDEQHLQILRELGMTSAMIVPMRPHASVIGAITFVSTKESGRHFTGEDVQLAHELAHRAAMAVDNARLFRDVQNAEAEIRLNEAMLRAQGEATLDGVVVTNLEGAVVYHNRRMLEHFELYEEQLLRWPNPEIFGPHIVDQEGFRARLNELSDPRAFGRDRLVFKDGRVFDRWTAPLVDETGDVRGRGWYYRDVTAERRAEEVLEDARRRASFLAEAAAALTSTMDYRLLLERLADVTTEWFADWCAIDLVQRDGTIERLVIASKDRSHLDDARRLDGLRHYPVDPAAMEGVRKVIATGQWDMRDRIEDEWLVREARGSQDYLDLLRHLQLRAHLCVPLQVGDRVIGAMTFVTTQDGRVFTPPDLALAQELAFRAATAVEHARLYQEHTHISETLQRSLLPPHLPEIPSVEVAARYHASGDGYEVGGDFYDLFKTGRDEWAIVLGDVCGKGADAAATTALARHTLRAAATQTKKPHRILQILNEAMLRSEQPFCTVAYARFHRTADTARITVACGGHPMPLVVRADGTIETLGKPGTLLGCFPEPKVNEESMDLRRGDTVVLYTDGVTEARSQGNVLGDSGLRAALVRSAGCSADEVADAVLKAALDFQDGDARDDIAIVVLKIV